MQNRSPATDRCNTRWYFKFPTDFNDTYENNRRFVYYSVIPLLLPTTTPNDAQSTYFRVDFRDGSRWFATGKTSRKDFRYLSKISWIWIEFFAEHIVKMLLKHCKKFTVDEIAELVKITKQEIATLAKSNNEMSVLLIDSVDTVLLLYVQNTYFQVI